MSSEPASLEDVITWIEDYWPVHIGILLEYVHKQGTKRATTTGLATNIQYSSAMGITLYDASLFAHLCRNTARKWGLIWLGNQSRLHMTDLGKQVLLHLRLSSSQIKED